MSVCRAVEFSCLRLMGATMKTFWVGFLSMVWLAGCSRSVDSAASMAGTQSGGGSSDSGGSLDSGRSDTGSQAAMVTFEDFVDAYAAELCAWATRCQLLNVFGGTPAACLDVVSAQVAADYGSDACQFDSVSAAACLDGLQLSTCDGYQEDPACESICQ